MTCRQLGSAFLIASTLFGVVTTYSLSHAQTTGLIYIMRHADKAESNADAVEVAGFNSYCFPENGLSAEGRDRAKRLGKRFAKEGVVFQKAFSSIKCRTAHTSFLVSGLEPNQTMVKPRDSTAYATTLIDNLREAEGNILVVLHSPWIHTLAGDPSFGSESWPKPQCYGEVRVYRANADRLAPVGANTTEIEPVNGGCKNSP